MIGKISQASLKRRSACTFHLYEERYGFEVCIRDCGEVRVPRKPFVIPPERDLRQRRKGRQVKPNLAQAWKALK